MPMTPISKEDVYLYKIKQGDTLMRIAKDITGSAYNFKYLAVFNNLEPPYIVDNANKYNQKAQGRGIFKRTATDVDITIPAGTIVYAPADEFTSYERQYKTLSDITIPAGATESDPVDIIAVDYGEKYNITKGKITKVQDYPDLEFENTVPLLNAKTYRVLEYGDYLIIPKSIVTNFAPNLLSPPQDYIDYSILGADIKIVNDDVVESTDSTTQASDLDIATGVTNVIQALTHKLRTPKGSLELHPDYGSLLPLMVGNFSGSNLAEMIRIETIRTLLTDPRVTEVSYVTVTIENNTVSIDYGIKIIGYDNIVKDNLVFRRYN